MTEEKALRHPLTLQAAAAGPLSALEKTWQGRESRLIAAEEEARLTAEQGEAARVAAEEEVARKAAERAAAEKRRQEAEAR